jgi:hypothetical protein
MYLNLCGDHGLVPDGDVLSDAPWIKEMKFQSSLDAPYDQDTSPGKFIVQTMFINVLYIK